MKSIRRKTGNQHQNLKLAHAEMEEILTQAKSALWLPIDIASIVMFRISFGLIMLWEVSRYYFNNFIEIYWLKPDHLFTYWPFDFVEPLPGIGMYILYAGLAILACLITIGLFYRLGAVLFCLGVVYTFLLDESRYLNHAYLICLISFVMIFIPANRSCALDTKIFTGWRSDVVPAWPLWLLRFMIAVPYIFGGIAKLNGDWLGGEPLRTWLLDETDIPILGRFLSEEWMIYALSYSGLLFDLLIIPFLLFKRTRWVAFGVVILFNLMNSIMFEIGIFPWFMIFSTTLFFGPAWPRKIWQTLFPAKKQFAFVVADDWNSTISTVTKRNIVMTGLGMWMGFHVLFPLRHLFIPGNVHWTEEGHKYAWHMKLRTKTSKAVIQVKDKNNGELDKISIKKYLTSWQARRVPGNPDMLWQFGQLLKSEFAQKGMEVSVHADISVSLNGRAYQQMISPDTDLTSVPRPVFGHADWILPLITPLHERRMDPEKVEKEDE